MAEETKTTETKAKPPAKKAKPPKLEDKPFLEFMQEHFIPEFQKTLQDRELPDIDLSLKEDKISVVGYEQMDKCWQLVGKMNERQFFVYFLEGTIHAQKAFACTVDEKQPSTIESFMIDERKANLPLMIAFILKRLNGQKWLARN